MYQFPVLCINTVFVITYIMILFWQECSRTMFGNLCLWEWKFVIEAWNVIRSRFHHWHWNNNFCIRQKDVWKNMEWNCLQAERMSGFLVKAVVMPFWHPYPPWTFTTRFTRNISFVADVVSPCLYINGGNSLRACLLFFTSLAQAEFKGNCWPVAIFSLLLTMYVDMKS